MTDILTFYPGTGKMKARNQRPLFSTVIKVSQGRKGAQGMQREPNVTNASCLLGLCAQYFTRIDLPNSQSCSYYLILQMRKLRPRG
jgi:hypothetical protein